MHSRSMPPVLPCSCRRSRKALCRWRREQSGARFAGPLCVDGDAWTEQQLYITVRFPPTTSLRTRRHLQRSEPFSHRQLWNVYVTITSTTAIKKPKIDVTCCFYFRTVEYEIAVSNVNKKFDISTLLCGCTLLPSPHLEKPSLEVALTTLV